MRLLPRRLDDPGRRLGFCARFAAWALLLAVVVEVGQARMGHLYLRAVAVVAGFLLQVLGVAATVAAPPGAAGLLVMPHAVFQVTPDCTGLHALALFVAAVVAWPATPGQRLRGLAWGVPAFFLYSAARLAVLGLVANGAPAWTPFLHVYLLVLVNAGAVVCLWALWVNRLPEGAEA